jgi:hypothetical protein
VLIAIKQRMPKEKAEQQYGFRIVRLGQPLQRASNSLLKVLLLFHDHHASPNFKDVVVIVKTIVDYSQETVWFVKLSSVESNDHDCKSFENG